MKIYNNLKYFKHYHLSKNKIKNEKIFAINYVSVQIMLMNKSQGLQYQLVRTLHKDRKIT